MGYLLLADADTFVCRTCTDLASRLVWARERGYRSAKARRANGYVDRPLLPSEQLRLVDDATRLVLRLRGHRKRGPDNDAAGYWAGNVAGER